MKVRLVTGVSIAAGVVAVLAVVLAWIPQSDSTALGLPGSIPIDIGSLPTSAMAPLEAVHVTYVRGPEVGELAGTQVAWSLPAKEISAERILRLANAFGVSGDLATTEGGWRIGASHGPSLTVSSTSGNPWNYSNGQVDAVVSSCAPSANCDPPKPPVGVPTEAVAETAARAMFDSAGLDLSNAVVVARGDEWSASVIATPSLGGVPTTGLDATVLFAGSTNGAVDGDPEVANATGYLTLPAQIARYNLIGTGAAFERLQRGADLLGQVPLGMPVSMDVNAVAGSGVAQPSMGMPSTSGPTVASPPDSTSSPDSISSPVSTASTGSSPAPTAGSSPGNPGEPGVPPGVVVTPDPPPAPGPPIEPVPVAPREVLVTVASVELVLVAMPGRDGVTWLVPAYRFTDGDSGSWLVLGVDESFVAFTQAIGN